MIIRRLSGPKANTTEHINNVVGQTLIAMGIAEEVKLPPKNSPEWLAARLEQSRLAEETTDAGSTAVPFTKTVQWGIRDRVRQDGPVFIVKQLGLDTFLFEAPPKDAPPSIVKRFNELTAQKSSAEFLAEAKRQQQATEEREKTARRW